MNSQTVEGAYDWVRKFLAWLVEFASEHNVGLAKKPWIGTTLDEANLDVHRAINPALDMACIDT